MEWLAKIDLVALANALVILIVGLAAGLGWKKGQKEPAAMPAKPALEVATDFFDAEAIGFLTREVTGQAVAITENTAALKDQAAAGREHAEATRGLSASIIRYLEAQAEAEERREEREREALERENERLRRDMDEWKRRGAGEMRGPRER